MIQIFLKEFNSFLNSLIAYIVISVFLTGIGLLMWVFPDTSVLEYGYADMETLFVLGPYVFMFLIPAITMRMFAEEKRGGTIELLLTKPLTDWQIIFGKYLSGLVLVVFAIIPTLVYYWSIYKLGSPEGNIDTAGVMGSYVGLVLLGAVFTAIGIFSSVISSNQIISFIVAVFFCFIVYSGFESIASINDWGRFSGMLEQLGILYHYDALSKGLIDSRDVIYFLSVIAVVLLATKLVLSSRKW
ncbi:gliding motility-associated ABC transporter permease subunit GldF [Fulvivirga sediminis]|uniref:Gliding motility-associated ABC transporter permease subunit GldF n=1 Tax=Fulvivirga sediminis TaxID=2803949 RepID=A0A937F8D8_9BACT|nr:gliding motility-associated ABC transporter permease subunit GldF [Fulvivirga sediminis]MBL3656164.1 gliding motility-associated ABC transporter permease subunit GldF [Fulvivirga sediminis]